jgi:hypothetical protein
MTAETNLIKSVIKTYAFKEVCEIKIKEGMPYFDPYPNMNDFYENKVPGVYLWVKKVNDTLAEVIYIGLTQKSLKKRNELHERGFKGKANGGSNSGGNLKEGIIKKLNEGKIVIYLRESELREVMGEESISLCHIEEAALIKKFNFDDHGILNAEGVRRRNKKK